MLYAIKQQPVPESVTTAVSALNVKTHLLIAIFVLEFGLDRDLFFIDSIQSIIVDDLLSIAIGLFLVIGGFVLHLALLRAASLSARLASLSFCS
jgi:hypothetical protein